MREADERTLRIGEQPRQRVGVERPGLRVDLPFAHLDPLVGQPAPGAGIRLVVLIGDDDGLAGPAAICADGLRQNIGVGAGGGAEGQLSAA
jgi:hypothetical protein